MQRSRLLDQYQGIVEENIIQRIYYAAESLAGLHVLHVNTTAQGGGVAELLQALLPLMEELGIQHSWKVLPLDDDCNRFTAHLADLLQGIAQRNQLEQDQHRFLNALQQILTLHPMHEGQADIYFIHDFQLTPLASFYSWMRPAIWMCHVDTAHPHPQAKAFIDPFLNAYDLCVFNTPCSIFNDLPPARTHVITPTIDPFKDKNRFLSPDAGKRILANLGIDVKRPLITQVSRFSTWKNPWQVIDVYRLVKQHIPSVQVSLVGAMEATDDIQAQEVLSNLSIYTGSDPDIHLFYEPGIIKQWEINAFQRYSNVILQRSICEGFGLTTTEAMWKSHAVVATSATGLRTQIIDGQQGYITNDAELCAQYTISLLKDREKEDHLGQQAHERVRNHYLLPFMVLHYLNALKKAYHQPPIPEEA